MERPSAVGSILKNFPNGLRDIGRGLWHTGQGVYEITKGGIEVLDATALGLGAVAIMALGFPFATIKALISEKRIFDTTIEVSKVANNPTLARIAGYGLLAFGAYYSYRNALS